MPATDRRRHSGGGHRRIYRAVRLVETREQFAAYDSKDSSYSGFEPPENLEWAHISASGTCPFIDAM